MFVKHVKPNSKPRDSSIYKKELCSFTFDILRASRWIEHLCVQRLLKNGVALDKASLTCNLIYSKLSQIFEKIIMSCHINFNFPCFLSHKNLNYSVSK